MKMGAEEKQQSGLVQGKMETPAETENGTLPPPQPPAAEEPPKLEDIVTVEVVRTIIDGYNPDMEVVQFSAQLGSKVGDNYLSIMYAVDIDVRNKEGEIETLHVMLKTIPRNVFRAEMINDLKAFQKESLIYREVLPSFEKTQLERDISKAQIFRPWPKCYAAHVDGSTDFLAMENLKVAGYKMGNRKVGLDFNHAAVVMKHLARYHAISYAKFRGSREKILEAFPILSDGIFNPNNKGSEMQEQFFKQSFSFQADLMRDQLSDEVAAKRLRNLASFNFMEMMHSLLSENREHAIVTHGDFWLNNMLFKYDETDEKSRYPIDVKFVDFQLTIATSRLMDIHYFLMTSTTPDVMNEREEDMLMIYHSEFTSYAEKLGVNTKERGLTWSNLLKEADHFRCYGVFMGILLAPMFAADENQIPDMEEMKPEDFLENNEESVKKWCEDVATTSATLKVREIVTRHMPRCETLAALL